MRGRALRSALNAQEISHMFATTMTLDALRQFYRDGGTVADVVDAVLDRIASGSGPHAWIHVEARAELHTRARELEQRRRAGQSLPLFGVPYGAKDNIDAAGMPATAACPAFSHLPARSARVVEWLSEAGAICIGKTNLDQFATGLNGTRSPYGICHAIGNAQYISGGSSSGSAVAVAAGHVAFTLGTDTGGSGRIPAGFNGIVGLKPSVGRVSTVGLVPNCPSIDCVSIFANVIGDAQAVLAVLDRFDPEDPFARPGDRGRDAQLTKDFAFGRLASEAVETFGAPECRELYETACTRLTRSGGRPVEIDFSPFLEAGRMLFDGPWIAERAGSLASFLAAHPDAVLPEIASVLAAAKRITAADVFAAQRQLLRLRRTVDELLTSVGTIMAPTAPRPFLIDELRAEPIAANSRVGYYTHAANLLDLCAISVPNTVTASGVDMGVTFFGGAWQDEGIAAIAARFVATNA
jgi:allophanate hydrolase